jgi:hypothetical protein
VRAHDHPEQGRSEPTGPAGSGISNGYRGFYAGINRLSGQYPNITQIFISKNANAIYKNKTDNTISQKRIDELLYLQFNCCNICRYNIVAKYHIDHIRPLNDL